MSANAVFSLVDERGWRRGLGNLLRGEYSSWFKSSRWWKNIILWFLMIDGMMAIMIYAAADAAKNGEEGPPILLMYGFFGGLFVAFGVMVVMQRVLVREKNSGTAAWVLSKPVTRTAFVVSRLVANSIGILLTAVIVPAIIFYLMLGLLSDLGWLSPFEFSAGVLIIAIHTFYWITMVLMMGSIFESSGLVIGVPMIIFFVFFYGPDLIPSMAYISPLLLIFSPAPEQMNSLVGSFMAGEPVSSWLPLITTVVSTIVFIAVAIWRFNRQEF